MAGRGSLVPDLGCWGSERKQPYPKAPGEAMGPPQVGSSLQRPALEPVTQGDSTPKHPVRAAPRPQTDGGPRPEASQAQEVHIVLVPFFSSKFLLVVKHGQHKTYHFSRFLVYSSVALSAVA